MKYPSKLDDWYHVDNWIPTEIINDHTQPLLDEYYDINFLFYCDAFVFGHVLTTVSSLDSILPMNEANPPIVRNVVKPAL